tara:strand:+ start:183 stop:431 length:249 start_codon:yes stop_codon:yes gene_type:complete
MVDLDLVELSGLPEAVVEEDKVIPQVKVLVVDNLLQQVLLGREPDMVVLFPLLMHQLQQRLIVDLVAAVVVTLLIMVQVVVG